MWKIRKSLHVGQNRVKYVLDQFDKTGQIPQPKPIGRPTKATDAVLAKITSMTIDDRMISVNEISKTFKSILFTENVDTKKSFLSL